MTPIEKYKDIDLSKLPEKAVEKVKEIAKYLNDTKLKNSTDADSKEAYKVAENSMEALYSNIAQKYPESIKSKVAKTPEPKTPQAMAKKIAQASVVQPKKGKSTASAKPTDRGNITKLAKEIYKKGEEKWTDAVKRAGQMIQAQKTKAVKNANTQYKKLQEFLAKNPTLNSATVVAGSKGNWQTRPLDKERDASRKAKTPGKRISKEGNTYYEYRENRVDRFGRSKYPYLKLGGMLHGAGTFEDGGIVDPDKLYAQLNEAEKNYSKDNGAEYNRIMGLIAENRKNYYAALNHAEENFSKDNGAEYNRLYKMREKFAHGGYVEEGEDYEYENTFGIDQKDFEKMVDAYHNPKDVVTGSRSLWSSMAKKYGHNKVTEVLEYIDKTHKAHNEKYAKGGGVDENKFYHIRVYGAKREKRKSGIGVVHNTAEAYTLEAPSVEKAKQKAVKLFKKDTENDGYDVVEVLSLEELETTKSGNKYYHIRVYGAKREKRKSGIGVVHNTAEAYTLEAPSVEKAKQEAVKLFKKDTENNGYEVVEVLSLEELGKHYAKGGKTEKHLEKVVKDYEKYIANYDKKILKYQKEGDKSGVAMMRADKKEHEAILLMIKKENFKKAYMLWYSMDTAPREDVPSSVYYLLIKNKPQGFNAHGGMFGAGRFAEGGAVHSLTSKNIKKIFAQNPKQYQDYVIIYTEGDDSGDFQEYVYKETNKRVPNDTPIGYEREDGVGDLILLDDIAYSNEAGEFAKGGKLKGKLSSKYNYVPNYMIQEVEVERKGKTTFIDAANILDGVYVKKGVKYAKGGELTHLMPKTKTHRNDER